jgi:putative oxidoreductase
MKVARFAARLVIGGLFIGHGTQKLAGWFGGPGLEGTEQMMDSLQMRPPRLYAITAGITETAGGTLLAAGLVTPLASAGLVGTMITAIRKVHGSKGPWNMSGGYEYNLVLIAALLALAEGGPGELSLDAALGIDMSGTRWSLAALGLGAAASTAAVAAGRRLSPPATPSVPPDSAVTGS